MDKQILVNFKAVRYATFYYVNQSHTYKRRTLPKYPTTNGSELIDPNGEAFPHTDYPNETNLQRASRLNLVDIWTPVCELEFAAHRKLKFIGEEAVKMWKSYRAYIYGKQTRSPKVQGQ